MIHFLGVVDTPKNIFVLLFIGWSFGVATGAYMMFKWGR